MNNEHNEIAKCLPVKTGGAGVPHAPITEMNIETRAFSADSWVVSANFSAVLHPYKGGKPPVVRVPHGYGFYWLRTYNAGWTDKKNNNPPTRPLEGFPFEHKGQYIYDADRAQLVSMAGNDVYVAYFPSVDVSRGGNSHYENRSGIDWDLYFYMNDNLSLYDDNAGSANCDIVVFRLPDM